VLSSGTGCRVSCFALDVDDDRLAEVARWLSPDEERRASAYASQAQRRRFIAARGQLRSTLADYVGASPASLRFAYGVDGKPSLAPVVGRRWPSFNIGHSRDVLVVAVAERGRVGVDVEFETRAAPYEAIVARYFSARERTQIASLEPEERRRAFLRGWTRKEAFLKARGEGITQRLSTTEVTILPTEEARLIEVVGEPLEHERWRLSDLALPAGYLGALAEEIE
jgi:4'-phosphopantetheinyl transferase